MDPPYRTTRKADGTPKRSYRAVPGRQDRRQRRYRRSETYEWAAHGTNKQGERYADKYRIAYCMHEGDLAGTRRLDGGDDGLFSGHRDAAKRRRITVDCIIFSPACVPAAVDPQQEFGW